MPAQLLAHQLSIAHAATTKIRSAERPRLDDLARLIIAVGCSVGALYLLIAVVTGHLSLALGGIVLLSMALWMAWMRGRVGVEPVAFVSQLSTTLLLIILISAVLVPQLALTLPAAVLLVVINAVPYLPVHRLKRLALLAWPTLVAVALLSEVGLVAAALPPWMAAALRVTATLVIGGVGLVVLRQYRARLVESAAELSALVAMSHDLRQTLEPQRIGHLMARHLAEATGADACLISRWDRPGDRVESFGQHPADALPGLSATYDLDRYPLTRQVLAEQSVTVLRLSDRDIDPAEAAYVRSIGQRSMAMIPLVAKGQTIGLVELTARDDRWLDERGLRVAISLADEAALALENAQLYQELRYQAFHDGLTGLANRALFKDRLEHALARNNRRSADLAVLFIDLDDFKTFNDRFGHGPGDQLLVDVAERLVACLRDGDTCARVGGDEYVVLLEDLGSALEADVVARRIQDSMARGFWLAGTPVEVGASVGIALVGNLIGDADELLRDAGLAMRRAKSLGKGRTERFQPSMRIGAHERRELTVLLHGAAERGELRLQYQPVVDLGSGGVSGFEALVRWEVPGRGLRMPSEFIGLAEETGLVVSVGRWVIAEACRQGRLWQERLEKPDLSMAVNLSARQFAHPGLVEDVLEALRSSGLPPTSLIVEITEGTLMEYTVATVSTLETLRKHGIKVAVDDFGTGYSSLSYLQRFPIDVLKVDRSFVEDITTNGDAAVLVRAIVGIGQALRLRVVAEGIERADQLRALRGLGCSHGQGYLFARPLDVGQVDDLMETRPADWDSLRRLMASGQDSERWPGDSGAVGVRQRHPIRSQ